MYVHNEKWQSWKALFAPFYLQPNYLVKLKLKNILRKEKEKKHYFSILLELYLQEN